MKSRVLPLALLVLALGAIATPVYWYNKLKSDWSAWESPPPSADAQSKIAKLGQAGDSFGPFNTVFASLAFVTALLTIWRQHQDTERAEDRRRLDVEQRVKDKEEEDIRHGELLAAQERIAEKQGLAAKINALATAVQLKRSSWERLQERVELFEDLQSRLADTLWSTARNGAPGLSVHAFIDSHMGGNPLTGEFMKTCRNRIVAALGWDVLRRDVATFVKEYAANWCGHDRLKRAAAEEYSQFKELSVDLETLARAPLVAPSVLR